jgi:hypothetical protein
MFHFGKKDERKNIYTCSAQTKCLKQYFWSLVGWIHGCRLHRYGLPTVYVSTWLTVFLWGTMSRDQQQWQNNTARGTRIGCERSPQRPPVLAWVDRGRLPRGTNFWARDKSVRLLAEKRERKSVPARGKEAKRFIVLSVQFSVLLSRQRIVRKGSRNQIRQLKKHLKSLGTIKLLSTREYFDQIYL